jgi:hypothetical protein
MIVHDATNFILGMDGVLGITREQADQLLEVGTLSLLDPSDPAADISDPKPKRNIPSRELVCGFLRLSVSGAELLDQEIEWGAKMRRLPQQQEESKTTLAFPLASICSAGRAGGKQDCTREAKIGQLQRSLLDSGAY